MVEVRCNACLHDARHVPYWCKTARTSCEKRQNREAPPLPVQPGDNMTSERLACWDTHSIQQSQSVAEQAAKRHVPLLQTRLCRWEKRKRCRRGDQKNLLLIIDNVVEEDVEDDSPGGLNVTMPSRSVSSWASRLLRLMLPPCSRVTKDCTHQHTYTPAFSVSSWQTESNKDYRVFCLFGLMLYRNTTPFQESK